MMVRHRGCAALIALVFFVATSLVGATGARADNGDESYTLYMADGQLVTRSAVLFISPDVPDDADLSVSLIYGTRSAGGFKLRGVYRNQTREVSDGGIEGIKTGTLILADLSRSEERHSMLAWWIPMLRVRPEVTWTAGGQVYSAVLQSEVNLGNPVAAFGYTTAFIVILLFVLWLLARGRFLEFLCEPNGRMSLSKTQMFLWTLAIGALVAGYGMIRLQVPEIPATLLALMGLSLGTRGLSGAKVSTADDPDESVPDTSAPHRAAASARSFRLWDGLKQIVSDRTPDGREVLSFTRVQMVFWTGLMLGIFSFKSIVDGILWEVPWEMVTLMGMSQVGYLAPKFWSAPTKLSYSSPDSTYRLGTSIQANHPSNAGGSISQYTVMPSLPAGLPLDPEAGSITGTPTQVSDRAEYTVMGSNNAGSTRTAIFIEVIKNSALVPNSNDLAGHGPAGGVSSPVDPDTGGHSTHLDPHAEYEYPDEPGGPAKPTARPERPD
ncbi:MAG: Ig domain-containing protein [Proteobacteria bacterium]|nr:Ig domain-containing protein [Pseudomonadota bacterium]